MAILNFYKEVAISLDISKLFMRDRGSLEKNSEIRDIVSERIRRVRKAHHISVINTAQITFVSPYIPTISKSVISKWENNQSMPDIDSLTAFADIFGVSVNWLIGRSEDPYDKENLLKIERKMLSRNISIHNLITVPVERQDVTLFPPHEGYYIPTYYVDENERTLYPDAVRGNIIFLLNVYLLRASILPNIICYERDLPKMPGKKLDSKDKLIANPYVYYDDRGLMEISEQLGEFHLGSSYNEAHMIHTEAKDKECVKELLPLYDIGCEPVEN